MNRSKYSRGINCYHKSPPNKELLKVIIDYFSKSNLDKRIKSIKSDRKGAEVFTLEFEGELYYIKSYTYRSFKKQIKNLFRKVEAVRHFNTTYKLNQIGLETIEPIVSITVKRGLLIKDSIFVTKEYKGNNLYDYFENNKYADQDRVGIIKNIAQIWAKLIDNSLVHQDPALPNFLYNFSEDDLDIVLVDIDNIYSAPYLPWNLILNNLVRLNAKLSLDLIRTNDLALTSEERKLLFNTFFKHYSKEDIFDEGQLEELIDKINYKTVNKMIKWGKVDFIKKDKILKEYMDRD